MQKHKRRSLTLMILGALALVVGLVWMAQDATTVMAHGCADGNPPTHSFPDAGECATHTPEPPTNTPTPTRTNTPTPTRTNTPTPTRTNTPTPTRTNTPTPTRTNTPRPASTNTPTPTRTNMPRPASTNTPTPTRTNMPRPTPTSAPRPTAAGPPADCIVKHAATPAQLCGSGDGIQYYFVGPGGVQTGPYLSSISELAASHSLASAAVELYRGTNPLTGKPVHIDYLPNERVIRVSTFYVDTPYSMDKRYIFTVNASYEVTHQAW